MSKKTAIVMFLGFIIFASASYYHFTRQSASVIIITVDTLRADRLESYDYQINTSPNIKKLVDRGVQFEWAFSTSNITAPSHASIMTGLYPRNHSIGTLNKPVLDDSFTTLAEVFINNGYQTAAVVSNYILKSSLGLNQGFDIYDDKFEDSELVRRVAERKSNSALKAAKKLIQQFSTSKPFFMWVHFQDPHGPYETDPRAVGLSLQENYLSELLPVGKDQTGYKSIPRYQALPEINDAQIYRSRYDAEIRKVDSALGEFIEILDQQNFFDKGYLFLTSDHGEALGENDFYFAHGSSPLPNQTRVPLIIVGPGLNKTKITAPVSNATIFPTALELANIEVPQIDSKIVGLKKIITGKNNYTDLLPDVFVETNDHISIVRGNRMLVKSRETSYPDNYWENANRSSGGGPLLKIHPMLDFVFKEGHSNPEEIDRMHKQIELYHKESLMKKHPKNRKNKNERESAESIETLKTLGYLN